MDPGDLPVVVMWKIKDADGESSSGANLVHSQAALNALFQLLELERARGSEVKIRLLHPVDLVSSAAAVRTCATPGDNKPGEPQQEFCYQCGKPTLVASIIDPFEI